MGKFRIKVMGGTYNGRITSEVFYVDNDSEETINVCKAIFKSSFDFCNPSYIDVEVIDVDALYLDFGASDNDRIQQIINKERRVTSKHGTLER